MKKLIIIYNVEDILFINLTYFNKLKCIFSCVAPFLQMPGELESSELALFYPKVRGLPRSFAWLTGLSFID